MNASRLRYLAERIEHRGEASFGMSSYQTCIAGWACATWPLEFKESDSFEAPDKWASARDILGLTDEQADSLFLGQWSSSFDDDMNKVTARDAVVRLRGLAMLATLEENTPKISESRVEAPASNVV